MGGMASGMSGGAFAARTLLRYRDECRAPNGVVLQVRPTQERMQSLLARWSRDICTNKWVYVDRLGFCWFRCPMSLYFVVRHYVA